MFHDQISKTTYGNVFIVYTPIATWCEVKRQ